MMKIYDTKSGAVRQLAIDDDDRIKWLLDTTAEVRKMSTLAQFWYELGAAMRPIIDEYIDGRFTMSPMDAGALMRCAALSLGNYLEIGTLHGGSAIIGAMAKKITGYGVAHCVDPFGWFKGQSRKGPEPSPEVVIRNAERFGVSDYVRVHQGAHPPLPVELENEKFGCIFIDGDHSYDGVKADWDNLHRRSMRYVLLHDYNLKKHGVGELLKEIKNGKHGGKYWQVVYEYGKMAVLERTDYE